MSRESDSPPGPPLESRIERLERSVLDLSAEVAAIRREIANGRLGAPAEPQAAARARPSGTGSRSGARGPGLPIRNLGESLDLERLLGRYGMLGIAVLAAAAAVGTFLSWAIAHGYLTLPPWARIVVGLAMAVGIGLWGVRLRRTERSFGSSLLGLSLVIVLVCAYAAGPGLAVVPEWFAFIGAMAMSWALAIFARTEDDEPLWCVAFAGAAITPFVTSSGKANLFGLVAYAASVLTAASFAVGARSWVIAWRVFYAAAALLVITGAAVSRDHGLAGFLAAFGLPMIVAVAGVLPFAAKNHERAALRWLWILAAGVGFWSPGGRAGAVAVSVAFMAAAALWFAIVDQLSDVEQSSLFEVNHYRHGRLDWIDAAIIPLALCLEAANAIGSGIPSVISYGVGAGLFIVFAWRREASIARDAAVCGGLLLALLGVHALRLQTEAGEVIALTALALGALGLHKVRPSMSWVVGSAVAMSLAAGTSAVAFLDRAPYVRPPFATEASFAALCVAIALALVSRFWSWLEQAMDIALSARTAPAADVWKMIVVAAPWSWTFLWGYLELSQAFSRSTSTLLLVVYFAACAVGGVAIGHTRRAAGTRKVGLALALLAAATAVYGARSFFEVGVRVLAYLVTSAFLLGIAYWYRRPGQASGVAAGPAIPRE